MNTYVQSQRIRGEEGGKRKRGRGTLREDKAGIFILYKFWRKKDAILLTLLVPLTISKSV